MHAKAPESAAGFQKLFD